MFFAHPPKYVFGKALRGNGGFGRPRCTCVLPSNENSKDMGSDLAEEYSTQTAPYSRQLLPAEYAGGRARRIAPRLLKSQRPQALGAIIRYSTAFPGAYHGHFDQERTRHRANARRLPAGERGARLHHAVRHRGRDDG